MKQPFVPEGEFAQWELIYRFLLRLNPDVGDVVSFEQIKEACGFDLRRNRNAFYKAAKQWCEEYHRAFVPVHKVGYRVAHATEHEILARKQHRKSRRSLGKGLAHIRNTDLDQLSPADRDRFVRIEFEMSRQAEVIRRIDLRTDRMQRALEEGRQAQQEDRRTQQALNEKLDRMAAALRRAGIEPGPTDAG